MPSSSPPHTLLCPTHAPPATNNMLTMPMSPMSLHAGISFPRPFHPRTAITSQEDAAVWIGNFDWERMEFVDEGKVYHFPRDEVGGGGGERWGERKGGGADGQGGWL